MGARVLSVSLNQEHNFSKKREGRIMLVKGLGVEGDAHFGATVQHRSRVARNPEQPNFRQVHLLQSEILEELKTKGYTINPGEMGENITTRGIDLLSLPTNAELRIGKEAVVQVKGLRNPCSQIDDFKNGLMRQFVRKDDSGNPVYLAGVMGVVLTGGEVKPGDSIVVSMPGKPHLKLDLV